MGTRVTRTVRRAHAEVLEPSGTRKWQGFLASEPRNLEKMSCWLVLWRGTPVVRDRALSRGRETVRSARSCAPLTLALSHCRATLTLAGFCCVNAPLRIKQRNYWTGARQRGQRGVPSQRVPGWVQGWPAPRRPARAGGSLNPNDAAYVPSHAAPQPAQNNVRVGGARQRHRNRLGLSDAYARGLRWDLLGWRAPHLRNSPSQRCRGPPNQALKTGERPTKPAVEQGNGNRETLRARRG